MYSGAFVGLQVARSYQKYDLVVCPYHEDTHPSGLFWKESGDFFCPACKTSKRLRELMVDLGREEDLEGYVSQAVPMFNLVVSENPMETEKFVNPYDDDMAAAYLDGRRIPMDVAQAYGVLYSQSHEELVFRTGVGGGWVGRVIGVTDGPRYRIHGTKGAYWPHSMVLGACSRIVLSEGPFKAMMLSQVVEPDTISVSSQGSNPPLIFWQTMAQLAYKTVLIADDDKPGRKFASECQRRLPGVRIFIPQKPFDNLELTEAFEAYEKISKRMSTMKGGLSS